MSWLGKIAGAIGGLFAGSGGNVIDDAIGVIKEHVEDQDKKNELIVELIKTATAQKMQATIPIVDAVLKVMEFFAWYSVVGLWIYSNHIGKPFDLNEVALYMAGPGVVTLVRRRLIK